MATENADAAVRDAVAAYNRVIERARLERVAVVGSKHMVAPTYFNTEPEDVRAALLWSGGEVALEGEFCNAILHWQVSGHLRGEGEDAGDPDELDELEELEEELDGARRTLFVVSAAILVTYSRLDGADKEACQRFMTRVGNMTAYPYFRAFAGNVLGAAGVHIAPPPVLTPGMLPRLRNDEEVDT